VAESPILTVTIGVFAKAHAHAFTPKNIKSALSKTGIIPYNPNVITAEMMAPSLETSQKSTLPLPLASPIRVLASLIANHQMRKRTANKMEHPGKQPEAPAGEYIPVRRAMGTLASTSARFLVSNSPTLSTL
jgi:hypothetical protein